MKELNQDNFDDEVSSGKSIVDFWAPWCGPCKVLGPNFKEASEEHDDVAFLKVNVDDEADIASKFGVRSIPTLIFFEDGEPVERLTGAMSKDEINKQVQKVFG